MADNPFISVVSAMRDDNRAQLPAGYRFGTVTSADPFRAAVSGLEQDADVFLKNSQITGFGVGDRLLLLPIDDEQRYIILCKVVSV